MCLFCIDVCMFVFIYICTPQKKDELHFRTYKPVFDAYLDRGDVSSAFKLFVKMGQGASVQLQPETYVQLIACTAENGFFK
jgi:pentatricopeptide repeat protein